MKRILEITNLSYPNSRRRFPCFIMIICLNGLAMIVFVFLSSPKLRSQGDQTAAAAPASVSLDLATLDPSAAKTSNFTTLPLPDPGLGDQQGTGLAQVGKPAPDFTLGTLDGSSVTLSSLRGDPVLINFWASWCQPCRLEMPDLVRAYEANKSKGFVILGVNLTEEDQLPDVEAFVKEFKMTFPILLDVDDHVNTLYGLLGLPMSIFVNREGIITHIQIGAMNHNQINELVGEILG